MGHVMVRVPDIQGRAGSWNHKEFLNPVSVLHRSVRPGPEGGKDEFCREQRAYPLPKTPGTCAPQF